MTIEREQIARALDAEDSIDTLREVAAALEPVVGREVKGRSKDDVRAAILDALDEADENAQGVAARNAIALLLGFAKVEPREEFEARAALDAPKADDEPDLDAPPKADDEPDEPHTVILLTGQPMRVPAYKNDVVINPNRALLQFAHAKITPARARQVCGTYGRLNRHVSRTPDLGLDDLDG